MTLVSAAPDPKLTKSEVKEPGPTMTPVFASVVGRAQILRRDEELAPDEFAKNKTAGSSGASRTSLQGRQLQAADPVLPMLMEKRR